MEKGKVVAANIAEEADKAIEKGKEMAGDAAEKAKEMARKIISHLKSDLDYSLIYIQDFETDEYSSELTIAMIKGNHYSKLDLLWRGGGFE